MTDADDEPARYVLHPLPHPSLEESERRRQRDQRRLDMMTVVLMAIMTVFSVGLLTYEIAYGTFSTVMSAALLLIYAAVVGFRSWTGSPGVKGDYHLVQPTACAMSLEDSEREVYRAKAEGVALDGIAEADTAEYLRLMDLAARGHNHIIAVKGRLDAVTGEDHGPVPPPQPEFTSRPHVE